MVNGGLSSHVWWPEISPIPSWLTSFFIGHGGWACRTLGASSQESINMHSGRFTHTNTHWGVFQLINDSSDNTCMPVRIVNWIFRFFKSSKRYIGNWTTTGDIMHPFISKTMWVIYVSTIRMKRPMIASMKRWHASKDATSMVIPSITRVIL